MRMSPSPSGAFHIGHVLTASISYLFVKEYGGKFYVRIEDTNPDNIYKPAYKLLEEDSKWLFEGKAKIIGRKEEYFSSIHKWNKPQNERDYWGFIIEEEKKAKGHIYLLLNQGNEGEIGFFIGKEFRGKNLSLKSTEILIPFAFNELNLEKISAKVEPQNKPSKRIIEKLNFKFQDTQNINNRLYEIYFLLKENF